MPAIDDRQRRLVKRLCLALTVVTLALYSPSLRHEFLDYDDDIFVTKNEHVQKGFTGENFTWVFTNFEMALWHPITWLSHIADYKLYGMKAGGHHFTGVLFHTANSVVLFLVLLRLTRRIWPAAIVAALFAWHPLHVESVAWVSERKDVLSCFFWLLTMWAYLRYVEQPSFRRYVVVVVWFVLGLMSKPMLVTLPFVLLLLDFWPLQRVRLPGKEKVPALFHPVGIWRCAWEKIPLLALALGVSALSIIAIKKGGALISFGSVTLSERLANATYSYALYLVKMFWPSGLSVFYALNPRPGGQVVAAAAALLAVTIWVVLQLRRRPYLAFGWFWYLGTLVPVIQIVQIGGHGYADRYTYVPFIGVFIMVVWGVSDLSTWLNSRRRREEALTASASCVGQQALRTGWRPQSPMLATATGAVLGACLILSTLQLRHWQSITSLFTHSLNVAPTRNYVAHAHLGGVDLRADRLDGAILHYTQAVEGWSNYLQAHINLGVALFKKGRVNEAVAHFRKAIKIQSTDAESHYNLAVAMKQQGKIEEAAAEFTEAARLKPADADAHTGLGTALVTLGRVPEAIVELSEALRLKSTTGGGATASDHFELANALGVAGQFAEAARHYRETLQRQPDHHAARVNLAQVLDLLGQQQEASSASSRTPSATPNKP
jgi:Flp pilus assembly protein TadD